MNVPERRGTEVDGDERKKASPMAEQASQMARRVGGEAGEV